MNKNAKNKKKNLSNSNKNFGILFFVVFFLYGIWPVLSSNELRIWSLIISTVFFSIRIIKFKITRTSKFSLD